MHAAGGLKLIYEPVGLAAWSIRPHGHSKTAAPTGAALAKVKPGASTLIPHPSRHVVGDVFTGGSPLILSRERGWATHSPIRPLRSLHPFVWIQRRIPSHPLTKCEGVGSAVRQLCNVNWVHQESSRRVVPLISHYP